MGSESADKENPLCNFILVYTFRTASVNRDRENGVLGAMVLLTPQASGSFL